MAAAGILTEDDRVELIGGVVTEMAPVGSRHLGCVNCFNRELSAAVGMGAIVQVQSPVRLDDNTEPQPDVALLRDQADGYASGHPSPEDVLLLIEVADSSVGYDRNERELYGKVYKMGVFGVGSRHYPARGSAPDARTQLRQPHAVSRRQPALPAGHELRRRQPYRHRSALQQEPGFSRHSRKSGW